MVVSIDAATVETTTFTLLELFFSLCSYLGFYIIYVLFCSSLMVLLK